MTSFDDPLKVLMPPQVVESDTIVVKRRIVSGHNAEVVPESAPARAVRVRTEEIEVTLNRYGTRRPFSATGGIGKPLTTLQAVISRWTPTCLPCRESTPR